MLADPQSVTINGSAISLPKTNSGPTESRYTSADGTVALVTKQNVSAKRFRREVRLVTDKIAADPLTAVNAREGCSVYIVIDEPRNGVFTDTEIGYRIDALKAWLAAANYNKVLGGEF